MPGYGVPADPDGMLPWSFAEQRLESAHDYWLATVWPDGRPHVMPVWGAWFDGRLWFSTDQTSRKARNLYTVDFFDGNHGGGATYRITPTSVFALKSSEFTTSPTRWQF